ncbi:MAG: cob(I)yrinic acid a,c-diamide adenosyltransferase [Spirochaetota bacterium]|nr:cob(I)yrinic acid a,c-diamide adenosyltransferase [Spirochaetota bacterium]
MLEKGYVQLYTGNGKGKTTAALGLALRAAGTGMKTMIIQFMKGQFYSELDAVKKLDGMIEIEQYGSTKFCMPDHENFDEHYTICRKGYTRAEEVIINNQHSVVILDEIVTALLFTIITIEDIKKLIDIKPQSMELILTGRGAPQELIDMCDLVTEMKEIKHYYTQGVLARTGIEN